MAFIKIHNVSFRGISACVPQNVEENANLPFYNSPDEAQKVIASTGIERRHIALKGTTAMDLGANAAECLLKNLNWDKSSVDLIAFCTQNPDYINLPNSFLVHKQLEFGENTMCLDYFQGCPGWVSSLSSVGSMIQNGTVKRAVLISGDTVTKDHDMSNKETRPLFGEGATATALEFDQNASDMMFYFGTL
ncbi:MAG: ketoacyl-ACP synthase III, partial [Bacteroidales bacterium]|nr:ketoacyl-ACP synthase III [Bacteroidales bacterium]